MKCKFFVSSLLTFFMMLTSRVAWYHQGDGQPNIACGDLEFGFILSAAGHCEAGHSLSGKVQRVGETIIASLKVP